jgi:hypothetical protein
LIWLINSLLAETNLCCHHLTRIIVVREDKHFVFFNLLQSLCCKIITHKLNKRVTLVSNVANFHKSVEASKNLTQDLWLESFRQPLDKQDFIDTTILGVARAESRV